MSEHHNAPIPWNADTRIACAFSFQCPQTWDRLSPTLDPIIRHCATCDRDVQLVQTEADLRSSGEQGACVAVPIVPTGKTDSSAESYIIGGIGVPYQAHKLKPL
jgi:hypothetical protein